MTMPSSNSPIGPNTIGTHTAAEDPSDPQNPAREEGLLRPYASGWGETHPLGQLLPDGQGFLRHRAERSQLCIPTDSRASLSCRWDPERREPATGARAARPVDRDSHGDWPSHGETLAALRPRGQQLAPRRSCRPAGIRAARCAERVRHARWGVAHATRSSVGRHVGSAPRWP